MQQVSKETVSYEFKILQTRAHLAPTGELTASSQRKGTDDRSFRAESFPHEVCWTLRGGDTAHVRANKDAEGWHTRGTDASH